MQETLNLGFGNPHYRSFFDSLLGRASRLFWKHVNMSRFVGKCKNYMQVKNEHAPAKTPAIFPACAHSTLYFAGVPA